MFEVGLVVGILIGYANLLLVLGYWKRKSLIDQEIANEQTNRAIYWQYKYENESAVDDEEDDEITGG